MKGVATVAKVVAKILQPLKAVAPVIPAAALGSLAVLEVNDPRRLSQPKPRENISDYATLEDFKRRAKYSLFPAVTELKQACLLIKNDVGMNNLFVAKADERFKQIYGLIEKTTSVKSSAEAKTLLDSITTETQRTATLLVNFKKMTNEIKTMKSLMNSIGETNVKAKFLPVLQRVEQTLAKVAGSDRYLEMFVNENKNALDNFINSILGPRIANLQSKASKLPAGNGKKVIEWYLQQSNKYLKAGAYAAVYRGYMEATRKIAIEVVKQDADLVGYMREYVKEPAQQGIVSEELMDTAFSCKDLCKPLEPVTLSRYQGQARATIADYQQVFKQFSAIKKTAQKKEIYEKGLAGLKVAHALISVANGGAELLSTATGVIARVKVAITTIKSSQV